MTETAGAETHDAEVPIAWFRLAVRLALAASLFEYGMTKVIPTQFAAPSLTTLVTPAGDLTLSALLWTSIGAAPAYEIVTGCVELLAGVLLLVPRTTLLGALIAAGALTNVFVLNLTYDVGLKVVSFHLVLLAVVLLLPDLRRRWQEIKQLGAELDVLFPPSSCPSDHRPIDPPEDAPDVGEREERVAGAGDDGDGTRHRAGHVLGEHGQSVGGDVHQIVVEHRAATEIRHAL